MTWDEVLAEACAEAGDFTVAVGHAGHARDLYAAARRQARLAARTGRVELYEAGRPYRERPPASQRRYQ